VLKRWPDPGAGGFVKALSTYRDGKYLITIDATNTIEIRDSASGKVIRELHGPGGPGASGLGAISGTAAVNADGTTAAIMSPDRGVDLVDLGTGRISRLRISHAIEVAFTGRYLAVLLVNGTVDLWSPGQNGVTRLRSTNVSALGSNAGGVLLAEYDLTDSVLLQQPATGDTIGSLNVASPYFGQPTSLTFSDGGTRLFIAVEGVGQNIPGQLEQWNLSPQHWIRTACQTAGAGLTPGEWRQATGTRAPAQLACDGGQE
jgi:WD40 repeat protein